MIWRLLKIVLALLALAALWSGVQAWRVLDRHEVFKEPVFDTVAPQLPEDLGERAVLVFSKTNGYRHLEAIPRVEQLFREFAQAEGQRLVVTENAAIFNPEQLRHFRLVVWNNNTNSVLLPEQQAALSAWLQDGGRWLGIHGAGGSQDYGWPWFRDELLRAQFTGHPLMPQFRQGTLSVEDRAHPATAHLDAHWTRTEEWYSFAASPRARGVNVLITLDESSYDPPERLRMGSDHPLVWWHRVGTGYAFYSALGHQGSAYDEPEHRALLLNAARWLLAAGDESTAAGAAEPAPPAPG